MSELQFGYFNFQGRGQVSRLLLAYTNTQYKEMTYSFSKIAEWVQDKQNLGLDFPSLPYIIDEKLKLTESKAIEMYIIMRSKRASLLGKNNKQKARIDNIIGILKDIFNALIALYFQSDFQGARRRTFQTLTPKLNYLNENISSRNHFLNRISYPDFFLTVVFDYVKFFFPFQYSTWVNLNRVVTHVASLEQIQQYYRNPLSISSLLAPEQSTQPKFNNLRPLNAPVQQSNLVTQQVNDSTIIQTKQETHNENLTIQQKKSEIVELSIPIQIKKSVISDVQQEIQVSQIKQIPAVKKQFSTRVQQYMKAAQAANKKGTNEQKTSQKPLLTASNLQSLKKSTSQTPWKTSTQTLQEEGNSGFDESKIYLGYWALRGLGQVQRHLLQYCQIQFEQKLYLTQNQWFNGDKLNLNLPFPNLPYLIVGDVKFTQSLAIDRYIIRLSNQKQLLGRDLKDQTYIENFVKILSDLFKQLRVLCFTTDLQKKQSIKLLEKHKANLQRIKGFAQNKPYVFGYLTWTDFYIAQISYYIEKIYPETYSNYPFFQNVRNSLQKDQSIKQYYARVNPIKAPFMPPSAKISF